MPLNLEDVDTESMLLHIRESKFFKSRLVPLTRSSVAALAAYRRGRSTYGREDGQKPPFSSTNGGGDLPCDGAPDLPRPGAADRAHNRSGPHTRGFTTFVTPLQPGTSTASTVTAKTRERHCPRLPPIWDMPTSPIRRPTSILPSLYSRKAGQQFLSICAEVRMKENKKLLQHVQKFFQEYLRGHRGMSPNTVFAYRDVIKLFLLFLVEHTGRKVAGLSLDHLGADAVLAFLDDIEARGNSVATRNLRLSALRTFFGYLAVQDPLRAAQYQRVIAIPQKQWSRPLMGYLEAEEVKAILESIDQAKPLGKRDHTLISLLYNTGARVQEICDLKGEAVAQSPPLVVVTGKGKEDPAGAPLARNRQPACRLLEGPRSSGKSFFEREGHAADPAGHLRHHQKRRTKAAAGRCPSLAKKKVSPHTFRHATAMCLLRSGAELNVIKSWLGHVHVATTHAYVEIDLEMKRKALAQCTPLTDGNKLEDLIRKNEDIISWLESL